VSSKEQDLARNGGRLSLQMWLFAVAIVVLASWCIWVVRGMHEARQQWRSNLDILGQVTQVGSDIGKLVLEPTPPPPSSVRTVSHRFLASIQAMAAAQPEDASVRQLRLSATRATMRVLAVASVASNAEAAEARPPVKERLSGLLSWVGQASAVLRTRDDALSARLEGESQSLYTVVATALGLAVINLGLLAGWQRRSQRFSGQVVQRRAAEEAQRRTDASFRALIEASPLLVLVSQDGLIRYANPTAVRKLRYGKAKDLRGGEEAKLVAETEHLGEPSVPNSGSVSMMRELRLRTRDGQYLVAEVQRLELVFDGQPSVLTIAHDVSERRRMQSLLLIAERMASVGTLAAGVGHEINNPLAYVLANLEFLECSARRAATGGAPLKPEDVADVLRETQEGAERIRGIVGDLKACSRVDEGEAGPVDLGRVIKLAQRMAGIHVKPRAQLHVEVGDIPPVWGNDGRLIQVFLNLLVNAAQAIPEGASSRNEVRVVVRQEDNDVVSEISDTGVGIEPKHLAKVFDPFFTTKPVGKGTGLGLAFCHGIVTSYGGAIAVRSEVGAGTTFTIRLRIADVAELPEAEQRRRRTSETLKTIGPRETILVVDDEPAIGRMFQRALSASYDITTCESGSAALDRIEQGERFDLIVTDLMMPGLSGMEVHEGITAIDSAQGKRMIFMTGGAFTDAMESFLATTKRPKLDKPFSIDFLRSFVKRCLETGFAPDTPLPESVEKVAGSDAHVRAGWRES